MRRTKLLIVGAITVMAASTIDAEVAEAQSYRDYCHQRAKDLSGYRGGRGGDVVGGAVEGAIGGAIISGILGGDKKDRKKAARLGALIGAMKNAKRPNSRAARIYRLEFEACMRQR